MPPVSIEPRQLLADTYGRPGSRLTHACEVTTPKGTVIRALCGRVQSHNFAEYKPWPNDVAVNCKLCLTKIRKLAIDVPR